MKTIFIKDGSILHQSIWEINQNVQTSNLKCFCDSQTGLSKDCNETEIYFCVNGRKLQDADCLRDGDVVHICRRLLGGKGGFGSMLRAIGAQIEKTTNREACRDLSGRRLRDINEEMRLKKWIAKQTEQKQDKDSLKLEALEKKLELAKHDFNDTNYHKERSEIPDRVIDAVTQGLAATKAGTKRPASEMLPTRKKPKLWLGIDEDLDDVSDTSSEDDSNDKIKPEYKTSSTEAGPSRTVCSISNDNSGELEKEQTSTLTEVV